MAVTTDKERGVQDRGVPGAPTWATEPPVWGEPISFQHLREQFEERDRTKVYRYAYPDGSKYETTWHSESAAQAWARINGHRYLGEVRTERPVERTPRDLGSRGTEPSLSPPPLVQAQTSPPPPPSSRMREKKKLGAPPRSAKESTSGRSASKAAGVGLNIGTWSARLLDPPEDEIIAADPKDIGIFSDPNIPREVREILLAHTRPDFGYWLKTELTPTVGNFLINLRLERNDIAQLTAEGIIFPGQSEEDQGSVLENGSQKNAFRHTFGQALITKTFGRKLAVASGFAHENLPTIDTSLRYFSNPRAPWNALFEADTVADQLNNEIGRQIAESLGAAVSNRDVAAAVLSEFKDKGLYVATFEMPGVVKLSRQRLTQQQFSQMMTLLNSLNDSGKSLAAERQREEERIERERKRRELREMKR